MALYRRLTGRLFYCLISVAVCVVLGRAVPPPGPATTVIQDVIYRADGTPAQGTLLISWPAFVTAEHKAVAAGTLSVAIGTGGAISLALTPNQGATPAGTYYRVLLKLDDLKSQMQQLLGNGHPGRLHDLEARVAAHEVFVQRATGLTLLFGPLLLIATLVTDYLYLSGGR